MPATFTPDHICKTTTLHVTFRCNKIHEKHTARSPKNTAKPLPGNSFHFSVMLGGLYLLSLRYISLSFSEEGQGEAKIYRTRSPKNIAKPLPGKGFHFSVMLASICYRYVTSSSPFPERIRERPKYTAPAPPKTQQNPYPARLSFSVILVGHLLLSVRYVAPPSPFSGRVRERQKCLSPPRKTH